MAMAPPKHHTTGMVREMGDNPQHDEQQWFGSRIRALLQSEGLGSGLSNLRFGGVRSSPEERGKPAVMALGSWCRRVVSQKHLCNQVARA